MTDRVRQGRLHPLAIVTGRWGGAVVGRAKRRVVRWLYNHLARRYPAADWTTMNYGFAPLPGEAAFALPGEAACALPDGWGEANGLRLYHHVASFGQHGSRLEGLDVVEVGSGRGGGAAFVAATLGPRSLVAVDVAAEAVALAAGRYGALRNLSFVQGDAEDLRLPPASADLVLNVESAHCYASVPRFLAEVARVLRPGGQLLFAGFAAKGGGAYERLVSAFRGSPLSLDRLDDITPNVLAALAEDEARKEGLIGRELTGPMRSFAIGAYAMEGTAMRRALVLGETIYLVAALTKPGEGLASRITSLR